MAAPLVVGAESDPFAFLSPTVQISVADRQRIERGETIVNVLPSRGHEISMVAITLASMSPERLAAWASDIERLKATPGVHRVKRLSAEPAASEFSTLALPDDDIRDVRDCRPGSCNLKLTSAEIERMRREMQAAGQGWLARGHAVFREIAHDRVVTYLTGGHAALAPYADGHGEQSRAAGFAGVISNSAFLQNLPALRTLLGRPAPSGAGVTSFRYWSVEQLGAKPVASATETVITTSNDPAQPAVLVAGKQIYATHYSSASLNLIALVRRPASSGPPCYLIVVNRSSIDSIGGLFGGITRRIIEGRMKRDAPGLLATFRQRIEAGPPRG